LKSRVTPDAGKTGHQYWPGKDILAGRFHHGIPFRQQLNSAIMAM
jgi:hypothetical protein